ncbi:MAG: hypothetical protein CYPHOPRED_002442 [Cyphobasidiales sp. Tagirdzhanova-0007]|nr:MAG: hypothetical protein CYPHOPRED_002442 [Cyphobasidiales sp. Tagirdzhanova-0007]
MDISAYCRQLVAQYLNANGDAGNFSNNLHLLILAVDFPNTLSAFKTEASPIASTSNSTINLEQLVEAWLAEQALLGNSGLASVKPPLPSPAAFDWHKEISPALPTAISRTLRNVHLSSILSVGTCYLPKRVFDTTSASYRSERVQCIVTSSTDKRVAFTNTLTWSLEDDFQPSKSATLAVKINPVYPLMLSGAMDGTYSIINLLTRKMESIKEHAKYIVRVAWSDSGLWFATLGYDKTLCIHEVLATPVSPHPVDEDEFANIPTFTYARRLRKSFPTNPEACVFLPCSTHLAFSRRDDNHLHYIKLPKPPSSLSLAIHPSGQAITAQTDTPISRILILPFHSTKRIRETLYTSAEQSAYSNPRHAWLDDGSGVAVSSDDGIIRIVDLNGKVKASISAHGVAAPPEHESIPITGELLRARYEADRGSSVIR